jgi:hypothetical protein
MGDVNRLRAELAVVKTENESLRKYALTAVFSSVLC